jgi:hypothetical protein
MGSSCTALVCLIALTLRGYSEALASCFGKKTLIELPPWEEWKKTVKEKDATAIWGITSHTILTYRKSKEAARVYLRYSSLKAVQK